MVRIAFGAHRARCTRPHVCMVRGQCETQVTHSVRHHCQKRKRKVCAAWTRVLTEIYSMFVRGWSRNYADKRVLEFSYPRLDTCPTYPFRLVVRASIVHRNFFPPQPLLQPLTAFFSLWGWCLYGCVCREGKSHVPLLRLFRLVYVRTMCVCFMGVRVETQSCNHDWGDR